MPPLSTLKLTSIQKKLLKTSRYFLSPFLLAFIWTTTLFLTSCTTTTKPFSPQVLGISDAEWKNYDEIKRKQLIENYNHLALANEIEDKNAHELALSNQISKNEAELIEVRFSGGSAMMPPFTIQQAFTPTTTTIALGTCQNTWLVKLDGTTKIALRSCYKVNQEDKKILNLDPSNYDMEKQNGTVTIPYSPLWSSEHGFVYQNINSSGYVQLRNITVTVKKVQSTNKTQL